MKITNRVIENNLNCRYKAFLALNGEIGTPHDYEVLMNELAEAHRPRATEALLRRCTHNSTTEITHVTLEDRKKGRTLMLNCTVETDEFRFHFDALGVPPGRQRRAWFMRHDPNHAHRRRLWACHPGGCLV